MVSDDVIPPLDPSVEVLPAPDSSASTVMARCSDCHHMMPEENLTLHQATAHHARPSPESDSEATRQQQQPTAPSEENESAPPKRNIFSDVMRLFQRQNNNDNRDTAADQDTEDWQLVRHSDVVDEWTCSRCTLRNPRSSERCSACNYARQEATTPNSPSSRRAQPASQTQSSPPQQQGPVPGAMMGGGALLGGIVGALIGAASGNPIGGAFEGAMNGAMGGAFLESASRAQQQEQARLQQMHGRPQRQHSRHNGIPMARVQYPNGSVRIVPLSSLNRHQLHQLQRMNGNGMTYEQVLQSSLGDSNGNSNLGADEQLIASIPTNRVEKDMPKDEKCCICLESFKKSDKCKTLPCMHGFHAGCVDQWLRTNASCPMCKHPIS
jgi:outer membrane lipoprotein SlyB